MYTTTFDQVDGPMIRSWGATPDAWAHWSGLGLTENLLPVVSNPEITISPDSKITQIGKTPSELNFRGHARGIMRWTEKITTERDIARWSQVPDLGICLQTRDVKAIDIDVDDPVLAQRIVKYIEKLLPWEFFPTRTRADSGKCLLLFKGPLPTKRVIPVEGGIIEWLSEGQQCVIEGTHPGGQRYVWPQGRPDAFPVLDADDFETLWTGLCHAFGKGEPRVARGKREVERASYEAEDEQAQWLLANWEVHDTEQDGTLYLRCPFEALHTTDTGITSTRYAPAGTGGFTEGRWHCLHAHCEARSQHEYEQECGYALSLFEDLAPLPMPSRRRFQAVPAGEFANGKPPRWLVKGVLPHAELGLIYGASGSGKSFFALDLVASVALGTPWRGRKVTQTDVVYVCAEGVGGFRNRIKAYEHAFQVQLGTHLQVIADQPNFLADPDVTAIINEIKRLGSGLVVIDTLAQVTPGGDENNAVDMGKALKQCRRITEATGAMVLLIHHAGKDASKGARGWSGIRAAADVEIEISCQDGTTRFARITKMKDGEEGSRFAFQLAAGIPIGMDEDDEFITSCVVKSIDAPVEQQRLPSGLAQRAVFNAFAALAPFDTDEVSRDELITLAMEALRLDPGAKRDRRKDNARRALEGLIKDGWLVSANDMVRRAPSSNENRGNGQ